MPGGYELSTAQSRAIGASAREPGRLVQWSARVDPATDAASVRERYRAALQRYDALRLTFVTPSGLTQPLQVPRDEVDPLWLEPESSLDAVLASERATAVSDEGAAIRAALVGAEGERHLVLTASAAVADHASLRILAGELLGDTEPDDPLQYVDYSAWEAEQLSSEDPDARVARSYWQGMADSAATEPARPSDAAVRVASSSDLEDDGALVVAPVAHWLAAWMIVVARHAPAAEQIVVGIAADGRLDDELQTAIGPYERYIPLAVARDLRRTFADLVSRVSSELAAARRFSLFAPLPRCQVGFAHRPGIGEVGPGGGFALELECVGESDAATIVLWRDPARVDEAAGRRWLTHVTTLLESARREPTALAGELDMLAEAEREFLRSSLTGAETVRSAPGPATISETVASVAAAGQHRAAVVCGEDSLDYAALDRLASRLSDVLLATGGDEPVGLLTHRSAATIGGVVGIVRAGRCYVPLDPTTPAARIAQQLGSCGVKQVVVAGHDLPELPADVTAVSLDQLGEVPSDSEPPAPDPDRIAYLMFTSGSTGTPKAVAVSHGNLAAYAESVLNRLGLDGTERLACATGISTDLGNTAIFPCLLRGGTVELLPTEVLGDGRAIAELVGRHQIDMLKLTPSHLRALLAGGDVRMDLPLLVLGGEALDWELVAAARAAGVRRIVNHYGPTETTVGAFSFEVPSEAPVPASGSRGVPIGRPLAHVHAAVLDEFGGMAPLGVAGELVIGGAGVAAGYWGQPEQTDERFPPDPEFPGQHIYRTGDLVRVLDSGEVEFLGRADDQVKIRGYRVELGEIESVLRGLDGVSDAAVLVSEDGSDVLTAYVASGQGVPESALRAGVAGRLPDYMVPAVFIGLRDLPRLPNGKLDRRRLALLSSDARAARGAATPPRNETEAAVLEIWSEVLADNRLGVDDNFFQVGGHSLLATRVVARARSRFGVELPLHVIFGSPTVALMAAEVARLQADVGDPDLDAMLSEIESMSEEEAERLLALKVDPPTGEG